MVLLRKDIGIMTAEEMITQINIETNEILDDVKEYIPYINAAIDVLAMMLVPVKDVEVLKQIDINNNDSVPSDFQSFIPSSGYPVEIADGVFCTYDGEPVKSVYYATRKPHINDLSNAIPFSEYYIFPLIQIISYLVKKKSLMIDFANADNAFVQQLQGIIQNARAR